MRLLQMQSMVVVVQAGSEVGPTFAPVAPETAVAVSVVVPVAAAVLDDDDVYWMYVELQVLMVPVVVVVVAVAISVANEVVPRKNSYPDNCCCMYLD